MAVFWEVLQLTIDNVSLAVGDVNRHDLFAFLDASDNFLHFEVDAREPCFVRIVLNFERVARLIGR